MIAGLDEAPHALDVEHAAGDEVAGMDAVNTPRITAMPSTSRAEVTSANSACATVAPPVFAPDTSPGA